MIKKVFFLGTKILKKTEELSALACRVVNYTGKYPIPLHPKHLHGRGKTWYLEYMRRENTVLDIGCHTGQHAFAVAKRSKKVVAIDIDPGHIAKAEWDARRLGISNVTFFQHDANEKLPFPKNTFNAVILFAVLEHLRRREFVLREIRRVLKKGGYLFLSVPNKHTSWKKWQTMVGISSLSDPDHKVEFTKEGVTSKLQKNRFDVLRIEPVALDMPLVGVIDLIGGISLSIYIFFSTLRYYLALRYPSETISFQIIAKKS